MPPFVTNAERKNWLQMIGSYDLDHGHGSFLKSLPDHIWADRDFALKAVKIHHRCFRHVSDALRDDPVLAYAAIMQSPEALVYAGPTVLRNRTVVHTAVSRAGTLLRHVHEDLRDDRQIAAEAVAQNGLAVEYISPRLRNDPAVMVYALVNNPATAYPYLSKELKNDKAFIRHCLKHSETLSLRIDRWPDIWRPDVLELLDHQIASLLHLRQTPMSERALAELETRWGITTDTELFYEDRIEILRDKARAHPKAIQKRLRSSAPRRKPRSNAPGRSR